MVDRARQHCSISVVDREDKALQRCTLSARSMPGDGQERRLRPVLLPSHPSSGRKATNLLTWGEAPSQAKETNYPGAVGHMSRLVVPCPFRAGHHKVLCRKNLWRSRSSLPPPCLRFVSIRCAAAACRRTDTQKLPI